MYQNISNQEFSRLTKEGKVIVIDVRTPKEVSEGYIPVAKHFIDINNEPFEELIKEFDKSKDYIIYCRSGARSGKACRIMEEKGFKGNLVENLFSFAESSFLKYTVQKNQDR